MRRRGRRALAFVFVLRRVADLEPSGPIFGSTQELSTRPADRPNREKRGEMSGDV